MGWEVAVSSAREWDFWFLAGLAVLAMYKSAIVHLFWPTAMQKSANYAFQNPLNYSIFSPLLRKSHLIHWTSSHPVPALAQPSLPTTSQHPSNTPLEIFLLTLH